MEPKPRTQHNVAASGKIDPLAPAGQRAVPLVLPLDWAQAVTRQQQLLNECEAGGVVRVCLFRDERGMVRVQPD